MHTYTSADHIAADAEVEQLMGGSHRCHSDHIAIRRGSRLSLTPSSKSSSPHDSPLSLSPHLFHVRQRCNTLPSMPPLSPRPPRDPIQPQHGSINSLSDRASSREDLDEDEYHLGPLERPRSRTCPDSRAWKRKVRAKQAHRPLTPPPSDIIPGNQQIPFSKWTKDKLRIPERTLPLVEEDLS